jgi:hypothetical protein
MVTTVLTTTGTPSNAPTTVPTPTPVLTVVAPGQPSFFADDSFLKFLNPIIDPIMRAIGAIGSRG